MFFVYPFFFLLGPSRDSGCDDILIPSLHCGSSCLANFEGARSTPHCHGYQFRLQRPRPDYPRASCHKRRRCRWMVCSCHLSSNRTSIPNNCGPSIIPRPVLLKPFRSMTYISRLLPHSTCPRLSHFIPFAPYFAGCSSLFSTVPTTKLAKMGSVLPYERKHKVTVVGSGNWYV